MTITRTENQKVKAHILNFWGCFNSHIEIVLEKETPEKEKMYYRITPWETPLDQAIVDEIKCLNSIEYASEIETVEIAASLDEVITVWKEKYNNESNQFDCCGYNCADISAWFLEEFAQIPKPTNCSMPITMNYAACGFFIPSFLQGCCPTLPGRIFDVAKSAIKKQKDNLNDEQPLLKNSP